MTVDSADIELAAKRCNPSVIWRSGQGASALAQQDVNNRRPTRRAADVRSCVSLASVSTAGVRDGGTRLTPRALSHRFAARRVELTLTQALRAFAVGGSPVAPLAGTRISLVQPVLNHWNSRSLCLSGDISAMRHNRERVIERTLKEFEALDHLVANLSNEDWNKSLFRPESKDPWTVKDALAHITYWKADAARSARRQRRPMEERGLNANQVNHLVYLRWHNRSLQEVLAWYRQVQEDVIAALQEAPEEWFSGKERGPDWPGDLDGHSTYHRVKDIEWALNITEK